MSSRLRQSMEEQWSFVRFLVGCVCSFTNCVGGWYFPLNMLVCAVASVLTGLAAHAIGADKLLNDKMLNKALGIGVVFLSWIMGLLCLWWILRLIVRRKAFPKCKAGCCCGMNDYSYRLGTWMGLEGWRRWEFVCSCGHVYEEKRGEWRFLGSLES